MKDINVLMLGPSKTVKGGMTTVVENYFKYGLDKRVNLKYIETINDKNIILKVFKMIKGFFHFMAIVKKYDIIHIHMASRMSTFRKGIYIRVAKKLNKKIILHIHGGEYKLFIEECNKKQKKYVFKTLNLADKVIVLSEEWKNYFSNIVESEKIVILYNSIIIPEDFKKNVNTKKIIFLGRIEKGKGIYELVEVIEKLIKVYPNTYLYIAGTGIEEHNIKNIIKRKKLEGNIKMLGWINEVQKQKYLKESSYIILPSYNEGMPMCLIEGMAYKNIAISTNVGGIPKIIDNLHNGLLIKAGNNKQLYETIEMLFHDKKLREKISKNARKTIEEKFNINKNILKLIDIYELK